MRRLRLLIAVIMLSLAFGGISGCQTEFKPGTLTDDAGREINVDKVPQRIVSHIPSITEIIFALGLEKKVVGVSNYCDYPEAAKLREKVGGFWDPSVEKIVALEPDLVLTNGEVEYVMTQLDELGITYIVLQPKDIDGILKNIELVGKVTGAENRAEELVEDMQARISYVTRQVKEAPRRRVFYTFAATDLNSPWTAGPGSFIDSLIALAGGENIGAKASAPWVQFSIEEIVNSDPEVIIINAKMGTAIIPKEELERHPAWQRIRAVKEGKIYLIDGDLVNRSGPRIVEGLEEMAKIIHPELFEK